jgi:hypothetical protein
MMHVNTPGVYLHTVDPPASARLRLDITGFVGLAERGPLNWPQPLSSWGQYQDIFGDFTGFSFLAYAVFGFFFNGGTRCYIVRVAHEETKSASLELRDTTQQPIIRVKGINAGAWGNALTVSIDSPAADDLVLTGLAEDIGIDPPTATVTLKSVAGLAQEVSEGADNGDTITLIHKDDPFIRETKRIRRIDYTNRTVTFSSDVGHAYPAGSGVLGKGFRMRVRYQPQGTVVREETFEHLSLHPGHERYFARMINGDPEEQDYVKRLRHGLSLLVRVDDLTQSSDRAGARPQAVEGHALEGGDRGPQPLERRYYLKRRYYTGYDKGGYFRPLPPDASLSQQREAAETFFGLASFEAVTEVGLLAIPDLVLPDLARYYDDHPDVQPPKEGIVFSTTLPEGLAFDHLKAGQRDMLTHCERMGDRFAIFDAPPGADVGKGTTKIEDWPGLFQLLPQTKNGALYYPWIKEKAADFDGRHLFIPPCGHVAGIYSRSESAGGIGRSPANEVLQGIVDLERCLSNVEQDVLNPRGVNCLRMFPGRGLRVWGARTLSTDPVWRYVNVRRVYLAIVKHITTALQWTVFEPNDRQLWGKMTASLTLFLRDLFLGGALAGNTPEQAFFVKCNGETNPPERIERGEVVAEIGFAPVRPAEFLLVTITRTAASLSVSEPT